MDAKEYSMALAAQGAAAYKAVRRDSCWDMEWDEHFAKMTSLLSGNGFSAQFFSGLLAGNYNEWQTRMSRVLNSGEPESWRHQIQVREELVWVQHSLCRTSVNAVVGVLQDISSPTLLPHDVAVRLDILDNLPVGVFLIDPEYRVRWSNRHGSRQTKVNWKEHYGDFCYKQAFKRDKECENCPLSKTFEDGGCHYSEREMPDGRIWLINSAPVFDPDNKLLGAIEAAIDISSQTEERQNLLNFLSEQQLHLKSQLKTIRNLQSGYASDTHSFWEFLQKSCREIVFSLDAAYAMIWLREEGRYYCIAEDYRSSETLMASEVPSYVEEYFIQILADNEQKLIYDTTSEEIPEDVRNYFFNSKIGSLLISPIISNKRLIGFIVIANDSTGLWKIEDQGFVISIAALVSLSCNQMSLKAKRRQMDTLLANLPGAAFRMRYGENGVVFEFLSEGARDFAGFTMEETLHRKDILEQSIHLEDYPAYHKLHLEPHNLDDTIEIMFRFDLGSGKVRWALERSKVIAVNEADGTTTYEGFAHDITERMRLKEAELASEAKSGFLAAMSHEIRTPLNAIIGFLYLVKQTRLNPDQASYIGRISDSADMLLEIINTILDFSKIEAGKMEFSKEIFSLANLLASIENMFMESSARKGIGFEVAVAPNVPDVLKGDALHIKQVLINLIGNAVKFTERGKISLHCGTISHDNGNLMLKFTVKDTGIGMNNAQQKKVFSAFVQVDGSISRRYGGTGLGLAIVKSLVELMNGEVTVQSEPELGTEFSFTCQVWNYGGEYDEAAQDLTKPSFMGQNVLLVEDNEINQEIAVNILESINLKVTVAEHGQKALDIIQASAENSGFDLILMDIQMPVMDGFTAARQIRSLPGMESVPIVAMTAHALDSERNKCKDAGMNNHISKPLDVRHFYSVLRLYLSER